MRAPRDVVEKGLRVWGDVDIEKDNLRFPKLEVVNHTSRVKHSLRVCNLLNCRTRSVILSFARLDEVDCSRVASVAPLDGERRTNVGADWHQDAIVAFVRLPLKSSAHHFLFACSHCSGVSLDVDWAACLVRARLVLFCENVGEGAGP